MPRQQKLPAGYSGSDGADDHGIGAAPMTDMLLFRFLFRVGHAANLAATLGAVLALAPTLALAVLIVHVPWVLPAPKGGATDAFMEVTSLEGAFLVGGRSVVARSTVLVGPGAKLRPVDRLTLPPAAPVILVPGSYRLHLDAVDRTLAVGARVPLVLIVESAEGVRQEIAVDAEVRRRSATDDHLRGHRR